MKKALGATLAVLMILLGLPLAAAVVVSMGAGAATECSIEASQPTTIGTVPVEGPVGGPVRGDIVVAHANIPNRVGMVGFNASMPRVLSTRPDFVSLNEMAGRSLAQIEAAAPGYAAYREPDAVPGSSARESISNVVAWRTDTWTRVAGGRVTIVDGDRGFYDGRPIVWDRYVIWTMLQRADGAVVSMLSTHHMINPHKYPRQHGHPPLTRAEQYGHGMDTLIGLATSLAAHGPVLVAGDMNTHATYTDLPWSAVAKMSAAGYGWHSAAVDFIFYPHQLGVTLTRSWSGPMQSDHPWIAAKFAMNGVGPTTSPAAPATPTPTPSLASDVVTQLTALPLGPGLPSLTAEQAGNALEIARVADDLQVPTFGLQIALATALQESGLRNLGGGHAHSAGLFQQRPSTGWGTRANVTDPALATQAFFGRAPHTTNPGLLDVSGWEQLSLTEAAARVQRPSDNLRGAYAAWETVAGDIAAIVSGNLTTSFTPTSTSTGECATTSTSSACTIQPAGYALGPVTPELARLVGILAPMFGIHTVGGYRESAHDPNGHPSGLAADFMVPFTAAGKAQGTALAEYARSRAGRLGVDYIIWYQRIWSAARAGEGWRPMDDRGNATEIHRDHVYINVVPATSVDSVGDVAGTPGCAEVVYPVPEQYVGSDQHNWHAEGSSWSSWHTGTDFSMPCGTPVYAAHAGTVEIDTTQSWAGPYLVKIATGPTSLATWYAHMESVTVSRAQVVAAGDRIGTTGNLGNSRGCHLHLEVHLENGSIYGPDNVNPSDWLAQHAPRPIARRVTARTTRSDIGGQEAHHAA
ncbi:peptidoglycan DD-metalloendopeptidase family protein [Nocardioides sp.]|uniref:peptidoglycan DD-metalloendopeptidase family protein n=1 Tax=Nocardioides sp. TaxID=35761 RepID=UPI0026026BCA|nr:peptidoglycan DD-metalloendopeptidase family protein [Nocardioides sp.]MCW2737791.1 peptidase [Nocardioides sp.]